MTMEIRLWLLTFLIAGVSAGMPPATLTVVPTTESASPSKHEFLTECDGILYYTVTSTTSSSSNDGLYRYDGDKSKLVVPSVGRIRGLTCHDKYLYYFKLVVDNDSDNGTSWSLFRYNKGHDTDESIHNADDLSHDTLTPYAGNLYMGGRGPKIYKLTTNTDKPQVGVAWSFPGDHQDEVFPQDLTVHKKESKMDLYFVAPGENGHHSLWKFNADKDEAEVIKDLEVRTGSSDGTASELISFKNSREYSGSLYFALGPFDRSDGHLRLARLDGSNIPVVTQATGLDPSHLTVFQDSLYMSLRKVEDQGKYGVWRWDGRFIKQATTLEDEGKIHHIIVWEDDILVAAGETGPLVVWNGDVSSPVSVTEDLSDISGLAVFNGNLMVTASKGEKDENQIWSLTKGVWQTVSSIKDDESDKDSKKDSEKDDEKSDKEVDKSGSVQPAWSTKKEVSGNARKKVCLTLFFLILFGALGWWIYKRYFTVGGSGARLESFHSGTGAAYSFDEKDYPDERDNATAESSSDEGPHRQDSDEDEGQGYMA